MKVNHLDPFVKAVIIHDPRQGRDLLNQSQKKKQTDRKLSQDRTDAGSRTTAGLNPNKVRPKTEPNQN